MPLESLLSLVKKLRERIDVYGNKLRKNEALTRYALIDPLLRELGWDTEDPGSVIPEYPVGADKADYALLSDGKAVMIVEAKSLDTSLQGEVLDQGLRYSLIEKTRYCSVTDGQRWEIYYDTHKPGDTDKKRLAQFDLKDQSVAEACLKALVLWRPPAMVSWRPNLDSRTKEGSENKGGTDDRGSWEQQASETPFGRSYWAQKASPASLELMEELVRLVQAVEPGLQPNYKKEYVGMANSGGARNFVVFKPQKREVIIRFKLHQSQEHEKRFERAGFSPSRYNKIHKEYSIKIGHHSLEQGRENLPPFILLARDFYNAK